MKKIFALLLVVVMMMSLATVASAAETDMSTVTLKKEYKLTNAGTTSPAETFAFSDLTCTGVENAGVGVTTANAPVPTIASVAYAAGEAGSANAVKDITITLPTYTAVGIYTYTFTETAGDTAGVTYRTDAIKLVVTVVEQGGKVRVAAVHTEGEGEAKSNQFENTYSAGSLAVSKTVAGNMGDQAKGFNVTVTFTAPEGDTVKEAISYVEGGTTKTIAADAWEDGVASVEITVAHGDTVTFTNIPYGVTYTVVEDDYSGDGYSTSTVYSDDTNKKIDSAADTVDITNTKNATVDTGIVMDSVPFVVMLVVAAFGLVAFTAKKRVQE